MPWKHREFKAEGWEPSITVDVQERDRGLCCANKVEVNWSCMGNLSIERATAFYKHFGKALQYARQQQKRLNRKATP